MRQMARYGLYRLLGVCVAFVRATATGWSQSLTWLSTLGCSRSDAWSVSADAMLMKMGLGTPKGECCAFEWTASGGTQDGGSLGGNESWADGTCDDGSSVVGWAHNAAKQQRGFRLGWHRRRRRRADRAVPFWHRQLNPLLPLPSRAERDSEWGGITRSMKQVVTHDGEGTMRHNELWERAGRRTDVLVSQVRGVVLPRPYVRQLVGQKTPLPQKALMMPDSP